MIHKALEEDRRLRYQRAPGMKADLQGVSRGSGMSDGDRVEPSSGGSRPIVRRPAARNTPAPPLPPPEPPAPSLVRLPAPRAVPG